MTKNAIMISNYDYDFVCNNMDSSVNVTLRGGSTIRWSSASGNQEPHKTPQTRGSLSFRWFFYFVLLFVCF